MTPNRSAYDVYQEKNDPFVRMAVRPGAGLPSHVEAKDWEIMPSGTSQIPDFVPQDIDARGFSYFKLVP
jgi:hypothetical protein